MSNIILSVRELVKTYKKGKVLTPAVRGVSFDIFEGDFAALAGPSGSGKTTVFNQIGLLDKPTSGEIIINGKNTAALNENKKCEFRLSEIGFVFQHYELLPELTALENVYLPLLASKGNKPECIEKAKKILIDIGLGDRIHHYPRELSGGEQQRVSIARAIIKNPKIILADEPTANLDTTAGRKIIEILKDLNRKYKITVFVINHERELEEYFHKIIRMRDGKIEKIEEDKPRQTSGQQPAEHLK